MSRARKPRAATGSRVGGGRLRVDAARAVHKLRDYQLPDPAMWALEAVRAAASAGASAVHVDGDSDDVWVGWEGPPIARDELPKLFDELVSPHATDERRTLRLLATAVNTALGVGPRWVDVYSIDGEGEGAARVRYTPELLSAGHEGTAEGLRRLTTAETPIPAGAPAIARGALVHLRRFPALEALSLLATGQEARELRFVRRACEDFPIPLRIARGPLVRQHADADLLRVRLDPAVLGEGREGFLAILDPSAARAEPWIDFAELGVVLATQPLELGIPLQPGMRVPVRARVDAARLPTNASRSAVRRDERWIAELEKHCVERLGELVTRVTRELGAGAEGTWDADRRARLRAAAIQLAAAWCGGPEWRSHALGRPVRIPPRLAPLFDAPLARDAIGRERSIRALAAGEIAGAHTGAEPLPEALAPWLGDLPWVPPGDALARLWGAQPPRSARTAIEIARASHEARARWLERAVVAPVVTLRPGHLVVAPLIAPGRSARSCVPPSLFARPGIAGEVAIDAAPGGASTLTLLVEGRPSETARLAAPLSSDAVATAADLRLSPDHSRLVENDARAALLLAVDGARVLACEAVARRLAGRDAPKGDPVRWAHPDAPLDVLAAARVVRAGIRLAIELLHRTGTGSPSDGATRLLASKSPLLDAPAWPTISGEHRSLAELASLGGDRERAVGYALFSGAGATWEPEGRSVLLLDAREQELLAMLLPAVTFVDYTGLHGPDDAARIARALRARALVAMTLEGPGHRGAIALHEGHAELEVSHGGRLLRGAPMPTGAPRAGWMLRVDDDRVIPGLEGARYVPSDRPPYDDVPALIARLVTALADTILGRDVPDLHAPPMRPVPHEGVLDLFFSTCRDVRPSAANVLGRERVLALRALPILRRAFTGARASADTVAAAHGGELVYVDPSVVARERSAPPDFHPLLATEAVAEGIGRIFQLRVRSGAGELALRREAARREARVASHRALPRRPVELTRCAPVVRVSGDGLRGELGLDRRGPGRTEVRLLLEQRAFATRTESLPHLSAIVDLDLPLVDGELEALGATGESRLRGALREATCELVARLAATLEGALAHDEPALALVRAWLAETASGGKRRAAAERAMDALRVAAIFETVQGPRASIAACTVARRTLRAAVPVEGWGWLGPLEGAPPDALDGPILALTPGSPLADVVRELAPGLLRDVSADVRRLQAARRVQRGLASRPRLTAVRDARFRWNLEDLLAASMPSEREAFETLGIGEIALSGERATRLELHEGGVRVARLEHDLRPAMAIACEPALVGMRDVPAAERERLSRAARTVIARAMRHLVESVPHDALPGWAREALRDSALLGGRTHLESMPDLPMFETTGGRWVSFVDLQAQVARFGALWVTPSLTQTLEPLHAERVAIRLPAADAARLASVLATRAADEELRLDAIARVNRARAKVDALGPEGAQRSAALGEVSLEGGREGTVLALAPSHASSRALHAFRARHPLGTLEDPSSWPALAWVDDPRFTPDRTWSAPARDGVLDAVSREVRDACERALERRFAIPERAYAALRVDRTFSTQALSGRAAQVRGVLWIDPAGEPTVEVSDAHRPEARALVASRGHARDARLPLGGELALVGVAGAGAASVLASVGAHAYERLSRVIAQRLAQGDRPVEERELDLAELVRAAALGFVDEGHPGASVVLPFLASLDPTPLALARGLADRRTALLVSPERRDHARELGWQGPVIVDDGSLAARRAIVAFGMRLTRLEDALAERIREEPARGAPETLPQAAQQPASGPAAAPAKPSRSAPRRPPAGPPARPAVPPVVAVDPLVERIETFLRGHALARGALPRLRTLPLASEPLAARRPDGSIELARAHPLVEALALDPDHPEALGILAAHVIGLAARGDDDAHESEADAILALLRGR